METKNKLNRQPDVKRQTGLPKSTMYLYIEEGKFPAPIKLSSRISVWQQRDIDLFIADPLYCVENKPWAEGGDYVKIEVKTAEVA